MLKHTLCQQKDKQSFTLIELLVVISIIAVLASLLLPALKTAKEKASRITELGDRKQLGLATFMYADDNDGTLPPRGQSPYAHRLKSASSASQDINKLLVAQYIGAGEEIRSKYMFCQSKIRDFRNPESSGYTYNYSSGDSNYGTLNYYRQPWDGANASGGSRWKVTPFDISNTRTIRGLFPVWSCAIFRIDSNKWVGHGQGGTPLLPKGANTVYTDGSGKWAKSSEFVYFLFNGSNMRFYMPETSDLKGVNWRAPGP